MPITIKNSAGGGVTLDSTTSSNETLQLPSGGGTLAPLASPSFTGTVSGADDFISTKAGGVFLKNTSGGTSGTQIMVSNTGGSMRAGVESSAGNAVQGGTLPYAAVFGNQSNYPTQFTTSGSARMTIDSSGNVVIGGTSAGSLSGVDAGLTIRTTNTNSGISYQSGGATTDQWETYASQSARFYIENTNTSNGAYLQYNSGSGWTNISDQRWKTDWTLLEDSSSKITALNIGKYHMLDGSKETIDGAKWDYGVKAQELFEVIPDAVDVPLDPEDKYGVVPNIVFWHTVKALQEALATIDAMETRLTALEGE